MSFYNLRKIGNVLLLDVFNEIQPSTFVEDFKAISAGVQTIVLHVNCPGGTFGEVRKMYFLLKNHLAKKIGCVVTYAASSATVLLMACEVVSMPSNAVFVLHLPHVSLQNPTAAVLRQAAETMDEATEFLVSVYWKKSGLPESKIREMMNACTWLDGTEAFTLGLCDEVIGSVALVPVYDPTKFRRLDA